MGSLCRVRNPTNLFKSLLLLFRSPYQVYTSNYNKGSRPKCQCASVSIGGYTSNHNQAGVDAFGNVSVSIGGYTSNHNDSRPTRTAERVFLLAVIHQTTTKAVGKEKGTLVFLLAVIHQTTTERMRVNIRMQCFYWRLYIKPQRQLGFILKTLSVSIGGYTSNHNRVYRLLFLQVVFLLAVIHQTTTP